MTDAGRHRRVRDRLAFQLRDAQDGQTRRGIPSGQFRFERLAVVAADVQPILATERTNRRQDRLVGVDESTRRPPAALHLNDRGRRRIDSVRELIRDCCHQIRSHTRIVSDLVGWGITQTGGERTEGAEGTASTRRNEQTELFLKWGNDAYFL